MAGASVRAAAFSALRAGLRPRCADLFGDADLRARCEVLAAPVPNYPRGLAAVLATATAGPWMFTGALENRPRLVDAISRDRPLWGNGGAVLRRVRSPAAVAACLQAARVPHPEVWPDAAEGPRRGRWLAKPKDGAAGRGISFWQPGRAPGRRWYWQEYVEGEPVAAVYVGDGHGARLLGVTRQLVHEPWLGAGPFQYCGSIGPLVLAAPQAEAFTRLGTALAREFALRGLFGVDCVLRAGVPLPVEVNPRYTASVEVLEHGLSLPLLGYHRAIFEAGCLPPAAPPCSAPTLVGKAILFAQRGLTFPAGGPWQTDLHGPRNPWLLPTFADIPLAGTAIEPRQPILSVFARASSFAAVRDALRSLAAEVEAWCYA